MRLIDRIAQCHTPYVVQDFSTGALTRLNGAADFAADMPKCPLRFVFSDELTRLCTALAYSKGARQLACADLLRIPAERVWVEWCEAAWLAELKRYGFKIPAREMTGVGRRGALIQAARDGRSGTIRTFWTVGERDTDTLASSMEAYFDMDTADGAEPAVPDGMNEPSRCVKHDLDGEPGILQRYFRFRYERSWSQYYRQASLPAQNQSAIASHALGTIATDIPMLLAFFLLIATRSGLPKRTQLLDKLNRARARAGKVALLEHVEVSAPVFGEPDDAGRDDAFGIRRGPRLHHVRGHLVRRGSQLFWRMPHLRGNARSGIVRSRTVTWTIDRPAFSPTLPAPSQPRAAIFPVAAPP